MASVRGLILALVAIAALFASSSSSAQTNFSNTYASMGAAYTACYNYASNGAAVGPCTYETATHWGITGNKFGKHWNTSGTDKAFHAKWTGGVGCAAGTDWVATGSTGSCEPIYPYTPEQCLARNAPLEGDTDGRGVADRLYIQGTAPSSYCNANCTLSVGAAGDCFSGINPSTGASVTWCRHEQLYTGAQCATSEAVNQDGNPANSIEDPSSNPPEDPGEWSCDFANGTCADPDGDLHVCTFTGAGTSGDPYVRSTCVPLAGDGDGDGIPNDRDSLPDDPSNGEDSGAGDETDNVSTGGGSCSSPPQSSGDGIAAQIAYQTWATRCEVAALRAQGITGGSSTVNVTVEPNTEGNASLAEIAGNTSSLADNGEGFDQVTSQIPGEGVTAADAFGDPSVETGIGTGFDDSGWLGSVRECPDLPEITMPEFLGGAVIDLNEPFAGFCTVMFWAGQFIWLFAALAAIKIYSRVI